MCITLYDCVNVTITHYGRKKNHGHVGRLTNDIARLVGFDDVGYHAKC